MLINSPNISGSLKVTGNAVITGSLTVLGGINATITGSATTASYVEYSNVANKPALVSGSAQITAFGYATTGSNQFNGSQAITGSLTVTGQVVAQTLNVQQVTSSIVYSSGSNVFGNSLANTQQFTGSLQVSGSSHYVLGNVGVGTNSPVKTLDVQGTLAISNNASSYWYMDRDDSDGRFKILTDTNNERLSILTGGNVGIGTASPASKLDINIGNLSTAGAFSNAALNLYNPTNIGAYSQITFGYTVGATYAASYLGFISTNQGSLGYGDLVFGTRAVNTDTQPSERLRITSAGNVGIGTNSPTYRTEVALSVSAYWNGTSFTGGNPTALSINNTTNGGYDSVLLLQQTDSGGTTKLAGGIGLVGTGPWTAGDNATQISDMYFLVRNSSGGISERMRIKSSGNVGIGLNSPPTRLSLVGGSTIQFGIDGNSGNNSIYLRGGSTGDKANIQLNHYGYADYHIAVGHTANTVLSLTKTLGGTDGIIINSSGNVGIGTTSPGNFNALTFTSPILDVIGSLNVRGIAANGASVINIGGETYRKAAIFTSIQDQDPFLGFSVGNGGGTSSSTTERMRITSDGNVGIGTTNPLNKLSVVASNSSGYYNRTEPIAVFHGSSPTVLIANDGNATDQYAELRLGNNQTTYYPYSAYIRGVQGSGIDRYRLEFGTSAGGSASTRMTISINGGVQSTPAAGINGFSSYVSATSIAYLSSLASTADISGYWIVAGNLAGTISHPTNTSTNYNTTSDYRLKENIEPLVGGIDAILKLNPLTGNYKSDPNKTNMPMFLAHEVQEIIPIAVTGEKDAMKINKETGEEEIDIQQLDPSKLIPHMVKAIQELKSENDNLKSRLEVLEQS
jgi:hypothetical protein